jgi:multidrug efflux pump subunit AcrA (membrane-fusion protein)
MPIASTRTTRAVIALGLTVASGAVSGARAEDVPAALAEALALAERANPELQAASARVDAEEARAESVRRMRRPRLGLSMRWSLTDLPAGVFASRLNAGQLTMADFDAATLRELEQVAAAASAARAQLTAAKDNLSDSELRAPFAGRVAARWVDLGDVVSPGLALIGIEGEEGVELRATVEPGVAATLRPGARVEARVDGQPGPLTATVTAIAPSGDPTTHRFDLKAATGLRAGLFGRLLVPGVGAESCLAVPATALVERGGLTGLFVEEEGRARLRWVAPGGRDHGTVEIRAGVEAGERVVLDPVGLADGAAVHEARES